VHTLTKVILLSIGLWWIALLALFIFPVGFLSWFAIVLSWPVAGVLLILSLIAMFKDKRRWWPTVSIGLVMLTFYVALAHVMHFGALANFYLHRQYYEATARSMVVARTDSERKQICRGECWIMSTDPSRVAFHYVDGLLNWHDIVYDPSGGVLAPMTFDGKFQVNAYFRSAEHLTGDWYLCHFSD
jgi:hypothetical protein